MIRPERRGSSEAAWAGVRPRRPPSLQGTRLCPSRQVICPSRHIELSPTKFIKQSKAKQSKAKQSKAKHHGRCRTNISPVPCTPGRIGGSAQGVLAETQNAAMSRITSKSVFICFFFALYRFLAVCLGPWLYAVASIAQSYFGLWKLRLFGSGFLPCRCLLAIGVTYGKM